MKNNRRLLEILDKHNQAEILAHLDLLDDKARRAFLAPLDETSLETVFREHRRHASGRVKTVKPALKTGPVAPAARSAKDRAGEAAARETGETMLASGQVAVLVVAGGQGTRLGHPGPKGTVAVSPVKGKTLFQLIAEQVRARSEKYGAEIPLLFMTSPGNRAETEEFIAARKYWGLPPGSVFFFEQGCLPSITPAGKLVLEKPGRLLVNPDGHGGCLRALGASGALDETARRGVSDVFFCQVDNPLVSVADPVFLGRHRLAKAEMSLKVLRRRDEKEKVGIFGLVAGKPVVVEYSDLARELMAARDSAGELKFWAGSIAIHVFALDFIRRLNADGAALPWHRAVKSVSAWDPENGAETIEAWKFERFVFDALPHARSFCCVETLRAEEFAPVKNRAGDDSPETTKNALSERFRRWLAAAGREVAPGVRVEIAPSFALDEVEAAARLARGKIPAVFPPGDIYLE